MMRPQSSVYDIIMKPHRAIALSYSSEPKRDNLNCLPSLIFVGFIGNLDIRYITAVNDSKSQT